MIPESELDRIIRGGTPLPGTRYWRALADHFEGAGKALRELRRRGMHIAVDDFGTGQSSLVHLRTFQFDILKIDKTFIRDVIDDPEDASLVRAIIQLGKSFSMRIVAEGVENDEQREFLAQNRCDCMQGYLISRPMPTKLVSRLLPP